DADVVADAKTLSDIADWCDRFTPLVALDPPHGLFLDITGCAHLFGGEAALLQTLVRALARQGFAVSAAIAGTSVCARTLTRLADTLVTSMEKQGKGARRLEAAFFRTDGVVRAIMVETGRPVTQSKVIDRLFRERLDALADPLDPGFGFDMVRLSASRTEIVVQEQRDLDAHVHDNDELAALIDRIAARIGGKRVVVHLPQDTHIPECAVLAAPAQHHLAVAMQAEWPARTESEPPLRPSRLFDKPELIKVPFAT